MPYEEQLKAILEDWRQTDRELKATPPAGPVAGILTERVTRLRLEFHRVALAASREPSRRRQE